MAEELYYIQDTRTYVGNAVMWWGKESAGYTTDIMKAGKYTKQEAQDICKRKTDRAWPCSYVDSKMRYYVDMQLLEHKFSRQWRHGRK
jgi:hypothetical protein